MFCFYDFKLSPVFLPDTKLSLVCLSSALLVLLVKSESSHIYIACIWYASQVNVVTKHFEFGNSF